MTFSIHSSKYPRQEKNDQACNCDSTEDLTITIVGLSEHKDEVEYTSYKEEKTIPEAAM